MITIAANSLRGNKINNMEKIKVWLTCSQVVTYSQQVELTKEEFDKLNDVVDVDEADEAFNIIFNNINQNEIFDAESEFTNVTVEKA